MHYFYPPLVMKLVEVVKGQWTTEETVEITAEVTRRSGREPVILRKELPGFLVNRILRALVREAYYCLEQGVANHADIDKAVELGLNHPLGPFRLGDLSGLDIGYNARLETYEVTKNESRPAAQGAREAGQAGRPRTQDRPRLLRLLDGSAQAHPGLRRSGWGMAVGRRGFSRAPCCCVPSVRQGERAPLVVRRTRALSRVGLYLERGEPGSTWAPCSST